MGETWCQDRPGVLDDTESGTQFGNTLAVGDFDADGADDLAIGIHFIGNGGRIPMSDATKRIDQIEAKFPFPVAEVQRLKRRRWILNQIPKGGVGAEVGVFRGHFFQVICEVAKPKKLYLVDTWTQAGEFFGWGDMEYTNNNTLPTAVAREEAILRTSLFPQTDVVIIEGMFPECVGEFKERLDWLYLDASHQYEPTLRELRAIAKVLKEKGVIIGDDWIPDPRHIHHGVFLAYQQFVRESDFQIVAAGPAGQWCLKRPASAQGKT